ncbi:MAG: polymer-forming cytoskeletal protein [Halobacteriales archaeon]
MAALLAVVVGLAVAPGVAAAEQRVGGSVVVGAGETVDGLDAVAGTIVVRGTVAGDLSATGGTVVVAESGVVEGDVSGAAGSIRIAGEVDGSVSAGAGSVYLTETGVVEGRFDVGAGDVVVAGRMGGAAVIGADSITVGPTARLEDGLRYDGDLDVADGASITGEVVRDESIGGAGSSIVGVSVSSAAAAVYGTLVNLVLGAFLLLVFPKTSQRVADAVADRPGRSGLYGIATLLLTPFLLLLVALTIVGIPLAIVGALLFGLTLWVSLVYGRFAVAAWALSKADLDNRWLALVVGVVGLGIVAAAPTVGGLVDAVVTLLGLGALASTVWTLRRSGDEDSGGEQTTLDDVGADSA